MKSYLTSFGILTDDDIQQIEAMAHPKSLKKGESFITEGSICKEIGFVTSGILRSFYHSSNGEEVTYCFTFENSFVSAYSSFLSQMPTHENIEALTDIQMLTIAKSDLQRLEQTNTNWLKFFKAIAEQEYMNLEKRVFLLQKESAETRYLDLMKNHPEYLQLIPLHHLSSYLGITQRHLSRVRTSI